VKSGSIIALLAVSLSACSLLHPTRPPNYIAFFRYDSAELTPAARLIVDQAAAAAKAMPATKIEIAGYLDSATAPPESRHLSEPRFKVVEQALIADGLDPRLLVRVQLADSEAALPATGDRRIEIWLIGKGAEGPAYHAL
jgi:outer membrane protein OmpA-like peptidoglycan-associated protein